MTFTKGFILKLISKGSFRAISEELIPDAHAITPDNVSLVDEILSNQGKEILSQWIRDLWIDRSRLIWRPSMILRRI